MQQRIWIECGNKPLYSHDAQVSGVVKTHIFFNAPLTETEKTCLDKVMADDPTYPPDSVASGNTVLAVSDLYYGQSAFESSIGVPFNVYYNESWKGSGDLNRMELHFGRALTPSEMNKVTTEFQKLLIEKDGRY